MESFAQPATHIECPQCGLAVADKGNPFCTRCHFDLRYGSTKATVVGQCIYCEGTGELSDEHVYGKWLLNVFGRKTSKRLHTIGRPQLHAFWEKVPMSRKTLKPKAGDLFDSTVRNVCVSCNTGWMSGVHIEAQPLVIHLAEGRWQVHTEEQCLALARWVAMVTINLECHGRILKTPQHQRTALMNGQMPDGWQVGFGTLRDARRSSYFQSMVVPIGIGAKGDPLFMNNSHFCIERAVFHARSSIGNMTLQIAILAGGLSEIRLPITPLWPKNDWSVDRLFSAVNLGASELRVLEHAPRTGQ